MLPIIDYHLNTSKKPKYILDDNPERIGRYLPALPVEIVSLSADKFNKIENCSYVIGAIDSSKSIISRSKDLGITNLYSIFQNII